LAGLLVPALLFAAELPVPEAYATIQAALDVAEEGDVVSVAPGVYAENVRFVSNGVALRSRIQHGATIQGDGTYHVVTASTAPPLSSIANSIEGFVITGGVGPRHPIFASGGQQVLIKNNVITGNDEGIRIASGAVATIEGNLIQDNDPTFLQAGIKWAGASGTIVNNVITGSGVAIWIEVGGVEIINNSLVANPNYGMVFGLGGEIIKIRNNIITGSEIGIYASGGFELDRSGYVGQFLEIDYNLLWSNSEYDYYAALITYSPDGSAGGGSNTGPFDPMPGTSEVHSDPLLDPETGYGLLEGSAAIDAGDNDACPTIDLDGRLRPVDGNEPPDGSADCDIGAVEYLPEPRQLTSLIAGAVLLARLHRRRAR